MQKEIKLSPFFINHIKATVTPHWGPLGFPVFQRTYARYIDSKHRYETWAEVVERVVNGNINLDPRLKHNPSQKVIDEDTKEAEDLYELIYSLSGVPSGRNLWISGTDYQKRTGDALNNCWFIAIRPQRYGQSHIVPFYASKNTKLVSMPFAFAFDELMKGGGVGFSSTKDNIAKIPTVKRSVNVTVVASEKHENFDQLHKLGVISKEVWQKTGNSEADLDYRVPDTREGWVLAMALMIDSHFMQQGRSAITIDVSDIRPAGRKIHGFGGTAAGPMPLVEMLFNNNRVLNNKIGKHLTAVDTTDMMNFIGKAVVAGNVRRSAEMALGSSDDQDFIKMKQDKKQLRDHRWASNNSIMIKDTDKFNNYDAVARGIINNGEPGIFNIELAKNYGRMIDGYNPKADPNAEGTNPCGEITLDNGEPCNLFDVFVYVCTKQNYNIDKAFRLAERYTKRVTFSHYDWQLSRDTIRHNRRTGVSISGIQDYVLDTFHHRIVKDYDKNGMPIYYQDVIKAFDHFYHVVDNSDKEYSKELHCNNSIKKCTVKPSGTVAKLAGISEGIHYHWSGYMIQRIRFQRHDPLVKVLDKLGYYSEPDIFNPSNTICVEFPLKAPHADDKNFASTGTVSMREQLCNEIFLQRYYADNSVSCTITFKPKEQKDIQHYLRLYKHCYKSTSMLPYWNNGTQMPKEAISKEEYEAKISRIHGDIQQEYYKMLGIKGDQKGLDLPGLRDCAGGACPVK